MENEWKISWDTSKEHEYYLGFKQIKNYDE